MALATGEIDGDVMSLLTLRGQVRSDKFPEEWRKFVVEAWKHQDVTRASEKARDNYRDREDWKSGKQVNKYLLEIRVGVALRKIHAMAAEHFADPDYDYTDGRRREFTMSLEYIRIHRPWDVVDVFGDRETSLCRYHIHGLRVHGLGAVDLGEDDP